MGNKASVHEDSSFIPELPSLSTRRFQQYPEYKDSGVMWLGEIPVHWEATRLRFLTIEPLKYGANEAAELNDPNLPRYIRITDIREDGSLRDETFKSLPERNEIAADVNEALIVELYSR